LFWYCLATVLIFTWIGALIGIPLLVVVTVWWVYRFVRGWLILNKGHAMYTS
jgi:uncharacterized membrane protein